MKKVLLLLSFMSIVFGSVKAELSLVVRPMYDTDCITALQKIGKLVYSGDSLYLYDTEQVIIYQEELAKVEHVHYSDERSPIVVEDAQKTDALQVVVYPNPTTDVLYVDNVEVGEVRLYTADGRLLQVVEAHESRVAVNMSVYPAGTYVLFCSGKAFSVIKK